MSARGERYIAWVSDRVVPALSLDSPVPASPFRDVDISRISIEQSFSALSMSPPPSGPPRRRANRNKTPGKMADESMVSSPTDNPSADVVTQKAALELLSSALVLASEWVVSGAIGADRIARKAADWCKALDLEDKYQAPLIPLFCRVALHEGKSLSSINLLTEIINASWNCSVTDATTIRKTIQSLLTLRGNDSERVASDTVAHLVGAISDAITAKTVVIPSGLSVSVETLCANSPTLMQHIMEGLLGSRAGCTKFCSHLIQNLEQRAASSQPLARFDMSCLLLLCEPTTSKIASEASKAVARINPEAFDQENGAQSLVQDLIDTSAA